MPAAMVPFTPETTRLKLSNVPKPPRRTAPPFGASGLTYSKRLKPAGYFSCPNSESAWRHPFSSACPALLRASGPIVGATSAAALLRRRVRRESFTDWLPNRRTRPRVSLNYGRFPGRQQRSVLPFRDPATREPRKSSHGARSRRNRYFFCPAGASAGFGAAAFGVPASAGFAEFPASAAGFGAAPASAALGSGCGLSDFELRYAITSARSPPRGSPAKLILVPGTYFWGPARNSLRSSSVQFPPFFFIASEQANPPSVPLGRPTTP